MSLPDKCLVDTNVPKTVNLATQPDPNSDMPDECVRSCIEAVEHVIQKRGLIIDSGDEMFNEYIRQLSMKDYSILIYRIGNSLPLPMPIWKNHRSCRLRTATGGAGKMLSMKSALPPISSVLNTSKPSIPRKENGKNSKEDLVEPPDRRMGIGNLGRREAPFSSRDEG